MTEKAIPKNKTKDVIYNEYERVLGLLNEKQAANLNPAQVKRAKRKKEVVEKTNGLSLDAVEKSVGTLRSRLQATLNDLEVSLKTEVEQLQTVSESLGYKQEEVQEIFGIEQQAGSLAALIQAQTERKETFERELSERRATFDEEQRQLKKRWAEEKSEYERQRTLQTQRDEENRTRTMEEYKYNFERQERERLDGLADSLATQQKQFANSVEAQEKVLAERQEELTKREDQVATLEARVVELEAAIETKVANAIESTKKSMNTSNAIAQSSIKKDYEAQLTVVNGKLETTADQLNHSRNRIASLEENLAAARAEVQQVAMRALDAQSGKAALEAVQAANATRETSKR